MRQPPDTGPVVFYDARCLLCVKFVERLLRWDRAGQLLFAPLHGKTAAEALPPNLTQDPGTIVLWDASGLHTKSSALLRIAALLPWMHRMWRILEVMPASLRDRVYDWVAQNRTLWFGRLESPEPQTDKYPDRFLP